MKAQLNNEDFLSAQLSWLCIRPMLLAVRGKDLSTKTEMYHQLNEGQKGLYLFYSFHSHVNTIEEFYWFSAYYITELKSWNGIKSGVRFFGDIEMVELLDQIERIVWNRSKETLRKISPSDLESDNDLLVEIKKLYDQYKLESGKTICRMNEYITNNLEQFIERNNVQ